MTETEILEFNKKCADYLKLELTGPGFPSGYFYNDNYYHFEDLKFHCDWNWLMEVIEKIELTHVVSISMQKCIIQTVEQYIQGNGDYIVKTLNTYKLNAVVEAIYEFLKQRK